MASPSTLPTSQQLDARIRVAAEELRVIERYFRRTQPLAPWWSQCRDLRQRLLQAQQPFTGRAPVPDLEPGGLEPGGPDRTQDAVRIVDPDVRVASAWRDAARALGWLQIAGRRGSAELSAECRAICDGLYDLERVWCLRLRSVQCVADTPLCVLLDRRGSLDQFSRMAAELVAAGVPMIQFREKPIAFQSGDTASGTARGQSALDDRGLLAYAMRLREITAESTEGRSATRLIINDRVDIAAAVEADGVHLGQEDLPLLAARRILGPWSWIGVSTHDVAQARRAELEGADYLGIGPTFRSRTKTFAQYAGLDFVAQATRQIQVPCFAIGGITLQNLPDVLRAGATRVAVQSAILEAPEPGTAARQFLEILRARTPQPPPLER